MELSQLQYFCKVAELEHFTQASDELHISQPALSKAILNLETELGIPLFERKKRNVYLTEYGRRFLKNTRKMLRELNASVREITEMADGSTGDLFIASNFLISAPSPAFNFIRDFCIENPRINFHHFQHGNEHIEKLLLTRKLDLAFTVSDFSSPEIEQINLYTYKLGVVVSENNPMFGQEKASLKDLKDFPFLSNNSDPDLRDTVYTLCNKAGFKPVIAFEGDNAELIGELLSIGRGIAFVSKYRFEHMTSKRDIPEWEKNLHYIDLEEDYCCRTVSVAYLKERYLTKGSEKFLDGLKDFFDLSEF